MSRLKLAFACGDYDRTRHEQGLSRRRYEPKELFAPESTEEFVIETRGRIDSA
jgi:hypothetical protein